jgi:hypothetical protein
MNHHDLTRILLDCRGLDPENIGQERYKEIERAVAEFVEIDEHTTQEFDSGGDATRIGFGVLRFKTQRFYSIKLGNLSRDRMGALGLGGALAVSATGLAELLAAGALGGWTGGGALIAIGLGLIGRAKPFVASFGIDEATTFDLAWRMSRTEHGFQLVNRSALAAEIGTIEENYGNAGFTPAKLTNALAKLEALGMMKRVGPDQYQLIEAIRLSDAGELRIRRA